MLETVRAYSLGYQGLSLSQYIEILRIHGVCTVVDVRETPWSYKKGFSKKPLSEALRENGISYLHLRSAGNPSKNRKQGLPAPEVIDLYRQHLDRNPGCLEELVELLSASVEEGAICLLCFEEKPHDCHRKVLLDRLLDQNQNLIVQHLHSKSTRSEEHRIQFGIPKPNDHERARVHVDVADEETSFVLA